MPAVEFTEDELAALSAFLRDALAADRFPLSPRVHSLAGGGTTNLSQESDYLSADRACWSRLCQIMSKW
jgi:hypothetical protein